MWLTDGSSPSYFPAVCCGMAVAEGKNGRIAEALTKSTQ